MFSTGSPKAARASLTSARRSSPSPTNWTFSSPCRPSFFLPSTDTPHSPCFRYDVSYHALKSRARYVRLRQRTGLDLVMRQLGHRSRVVNRGAIGQRTHDLWRYAHDQVRFGVVVAGGAEQSAEVRDVTDVRDFVNRGRLLVQDEARDDQRLIVLELYHCFRAPSHECRYGEAEHLHAFGEIGLRYFRLHQQLD